MVPGGGFEGWCGGFGRGGGFTGCGVEGWFFWGMNAFVRGSAGLMGWTVGLLALWDIQVGGCDSSH